MIISLITCLPTRSFNARISPSFTMRISFLTTAEVNVTNSFPSATRKLAVREAIICPTTSCHTLHTSCSRKGFSNPICRSAAPISSSILLVFPSFIPYANIQYFYAIRSFFSPFLPTYANTPTSAKINSPEQIVVVHLPARYMSGWK